MARPPEMMDQNIDTEFPQQLGSIYTAQPAQKDPLAKFYESVNIAEDIDEERLKKIGRRCKEGYDNDETSRGPWLEKNKKSIDLANQIKQDKTFPWRNSANIKLPIIADASIKFAARAYSEIIKDDKVVKGRVVGDDPQELKQQRADRVGDYMSYQLLEKECEWEWDTDKLLHILPVVGHMFRKRIWCAPEKRTQSELCMPDKVVISNKAASLKAARRITHIIDNISHNEVISNQRAGVWLDIELKENKEATDSKDLDEEDYYTFLEQQCWLDLDNDNYEEPYIVTIDAESEKVLRISQRWDDDDPRKEPVEYYTHYYFMENPDGFYGLGFGHLVGSTNKAVNKMLRQGIDAGTLANSNTGYNSSVVTL